MMVERLENYDSWRTTTPYDREDVDEDEDTEARIAAAEAKLERKK